MTITQARTKIVRLQAEISNDVKSAVGRALTRSENEARRMSSGPLTPRDLRKRDHPYAKRHGPLGKVSAMPGKTRSVINVGTGGFRAGWGTDKPQRQDTKVTGRLFNMDPVADYLVHGTGVMVRRPIDLYMTDFLHNAATEEVGIAVKRLERFYS